MTIPPELAALQRYIHNSAKMAEVPSCQTLIGVRQFVELDDVARAWPQRASGEAKPVAWQVRRKWGNPNTAIWVDITKESFDAINALPVDDEETRELFTHPADTSALRERLEAHWRHLVLMPDDGFKPLQEAEWIRTLLAGDKT